MVFKINLLLILKDMLSEVDLNTHFLVKKNCERSWDSTDSTKFIKPGQWGWRDPKGDHKGIRKKWEN